MQPTKTLLTASVLLSLTTLTAEASLTVGIADGQSVVYDNVTDITWTGDANLLRTMKDSSGYNVFDAIISSAPYLSDYPNGIHEVTKNDFEFDGRVTWFGAQAFTIYLNGINYAGSNQWSLPSAGTKPQSYIFEPAQPDTIQSTQPGELFYNALGGTAGEQIPDTNYFTNEQSSDYWLRESDYDFGSHAWLFQNGDGSLGMGSRESYLYAWAVSPGNVAATVPVPAAAWLFGSGLIGFVGWRRRGNIR